MIKVLLTGVWACLVALASTYAAAQWRADVRPVEEEPYLEGLEYRKLDPITVPMIADGAVQGYVIARLVFTADAGALARFPVEPDPFVVDETFREIYLNGRVEFGQMAKYDIDLLIGAIRDNVNARLGPDFIQDILVEEINYVDKSKIQG